jgi:Holliday junction resolvasome RuvABC endonuclease subunit
MIVMGLDLANNSGWAVRDSGRHRSSIECGVISVSDYDWEEKYAIFSINFLPLIRTHKPDFVAIERPEHGVRQFSKPGKPDLTGQQQNALTINPAALQLTGIAGAAIAICSLMNIPYGTIAANSWRPMYFGKGFKPPLEQIRDRSTGKMKDGKPAWKQAAIEVAEREGIRLPSTVKDQKDAAEAVAVCTCWTKCDVPQIEWMQKRFLDLRTGAYRKDAA